VSLDQANRVVDGSASGIAREVFDGKKSDCFCWLHYFPFSSHQDLDLSMGRSDSIEATPSQQQEEEAATDLWFDAPRTNNANGSCEELLPKAKPPGR
jgi:hypothetical protein